MTRGMERREVIRAVGLPAGLFVGTLPQTLENGRAGYARFFPPLTAVVFSAFPPLSGWICVAESLPWPLWRAMEASAGCVSCQRLCVGLCTWRSPEAL